MHFKHFHRMNDPDALLPGDIFDKCEADLVEHEFPMSKDILERWNMKFSRCYYHYKVNKFIY